MSDYKKIDAGYKKIRAAMVALERRVFSQIRRANKEGKRWRPWILANHTVHNALDRLVQKGRIRYVRSRQPLGYNSGYVIREGK